MSEIEREDAGLDEIPEGAKAALEGIVVVLWQTQDHVNIAGTIRAMKNFGLARLRDLAPELLARGREATEGSTGPVALLFGREDKGLSNEALDLCHRTCIIPTNPGHASLNLAQAVLLTAYELWMAAAGHDQEFRPPRRTAPPPSVEFLEIVFADLERALWAIDFFKTRNSESVMRTLRELVRRADVDHREAGFIRAMAIEVIKYLRRAGAYEERQPGVSAGEGDGEAS